jgi:hypothetical protein
MQPIPSPRLLAFLAMLRDFQRALLPASTSLIRPFTHLLQEPAAPGPSFQFALGSSSDPFLARAVVECVKQIKDTLGPNRAPDLCQLFVTAAPYSGANIRFAPAVSDASLLHAQHVHSHWPGCSDIGLCGGLQYVQECLSGIMQPPPVVIGGVVQVSLFRTTRLCGSCCALGH